MTFLAGLERSIAKKGQPNTVRPMLHWAKTNKPPATAIDCMERGTEPDIRAYCIFLGVDVLMSIPKCAVINFFN